MENGSHYNAAKAGVKMFGDSLRLDVAAEGIRMATIEPGSVATELLKDISDEVIKEGIEKLGESMRPLQPDDIARTITFVVSQPAHVDINEVLVRPTDQVQP
jgi:NADP-dependent 3-hydroxy acid dehydrogenase YdfG